MAPVIGVTCDGDLENRRFFLNRAYIEAVSCAGGIPLILPPGPVDLVDRYLSIIDGLLLTGGGDIDPAFFGQEPREGLGRVFPERDEFELALTRRALERGMPILALCRGMQTLNVAAGGTLYQDIAREVPGCWQHSQRKPRSHPHHTIEILPETLLAAILGPRARVNSMHHQAVRDPGEGLRVSARAGDGIIEALEGTRGSFVLGVQWHPEELITRCPEQRQLFQHFISAADISTPCRNPGY
ncbi:gamma-glutamyl-gamma-aminobutyrate hydrolase family protein [Thermanaeromonas sp. C210]|uniref:gamma-glutamyl-gamma-aminobutyrate hydrolase family protein n=1 Tax=Thermanaeromonas sp. C210 TaxID=2731925 RepID=UPI00155D1F93|nr:gamma-glutamyl-gamma-aminobutyrate hydrolase family protein [Thermanaeromonas sp. C210]GFN22043.1 peptidase C26 [Thermanaeromonas sp. C210]